MQVTFSTLVYILAFTGVYEYLCIKNKHVTLLGLLFIVLPIVSNIGTNVDFRYRSVVFIMPLVLFVFKYVVDFERKPLLVLFLLFILLTTIRYSVIFPNTMKLSRTRNMNWIQSGRIRIFCWMSIGYRG